MLLGAGSVKIWKAAKKAESKKLGVLLPLSRAIVRQHLEYFVQTCSPYSVRDIKITEYGKRVIKCLFEQLMHKGYERKLKAPEMGPLQGSWR